MRTNFSQNYHLPILCLLFVMGWAMIGFRIWAFRKNRRQAGGWRTFAGLGVILSIAAGITTVAYLALTVETYALDQKLFNFYDRIQNYPNEVLITHNPLNATDAECQWAIDQVKPMMLMTWASRFFLIAPLWLVKGSLLAIYLQSRIVIPRALRGGLYAMVPIIIGTFVVAVVILYERFASVLTYPTVDDIRAGAFVGGVTFAELDDQSEMILTCMNLGTDILLTFFAFRIITSLRLNINYSATSSWLLIVMGSITVSVAIIRLAFVIVSFSCNEGCTEANILSKLMMPILMMSELEAFTAIVVSCLPAMRATLRHGPAEHVHQGFVENVEKAAPSTIKTPSSGYGGDELNFHTTALESSRSS